MKKVIGEGSYGCVHKPSIHCETKPNKQFDYQHYVSKLMRNKHAIDELNEFVVIKQYDPNNEYHLGTPEICTPNVEEYGVKQSISKCKYIDAKKVEHDPDDYKLLLLKYGGPDLSAFCEDGIHDYIKTDKDNKCDKFWLEVHHLIKGLQFFRNNGIVHNDLKPQNILFDPKKCSLMYIDFGLMAKKNNMENLSKKSNNTLGIFHWSFPFDSGFINKDNYDKYKNYKVRKMDRMYKNQISDMIINGNKENQLKIPLRNPLSFRILFSYLNPYGTEPSASTQYAYIQNFFDGFNNYIDKHNYTEYLNNAIDSIDVFGLGFTLQYILNCFYRHHAVSLDFFTKASGLFETMYDFNPFTRNTNIENILDRYENILLETGVLTRLNKKFENNKLVNKKPLPTIIRNNNSNQGQPLSKEFERFANLDPITNKKCPPTKELNIKTNRCVNKCKPNYSRNSKFRCVKNKTNKINKTKSAKKCPSTKELNNKTNRCVNKCKPNYSRNSKFKCIKNKTNKNNSNLTTLSDYLRGGRHSEQLNKELTEYERARERARERAIERERREEIERRTIQIEEMLTEEMLNQSIEEEERREEEREAEIQGIIARLITQDDANTPPNEEEFNAYMTRLRTQAEAEAEHLADMRLIFEEEDLLRRRELERRERRERRT